MCGVGVVCVVDGFCGGCGTRSRGPEAGFDCLPPSTVGFRAAELE